MKLVLYTTHCPLCRGVEALLKNKGLEYEECTDREILALKGYTHPPVLEVDGVPYSGVEISDYIRKGVTK